ncbi:MAG: thiol peroxidase [Thermodesulfobacteriota bacterium]
MTRIKLKGNQINTCGELPKVGTKAPDFLLTRTDLSDFSLTDVAGKMVLMNIFPSIDTSVCSMSVRTFNSRISQFPNTVLLAISLDLPFAHKRFCETEGIKNVISASELRNRKFGDDYGLRITDGPMAGLLARAVIILDETGTVRYTQLVPEIAQEPDYEAAFNALKTAATETNACMLSDTAEHARALSDDEPCDDGRSG